MVQGAKVRMAAESIADIIFRCTATRAMEGYWHPQTGDLLLQDIALRGIDIAAVHWHREQHYRHMTLLLDGASSLGGSQFGIMQRDDRRRRLASARQ